MRKNKWVIVCYMGNTPFYYEGYFQREKLEVSLYKPSISISYEDALKLNTEEEALRIKEGLNRSDWVVEEHI